MRKKEGSEPYENDDQDILSYLISKIKQESTDTNIFILQALTWFASNHFGRMRLLQYNIY